MTPADHVRCRARKDEIHSRKPGSWGEPGLFALGRLIAALASVEQESRTYFFVSWPRISPSGNLAE
jgi:hypothetical protein